MAAIIGLGIALAFAPVHAAQAQANQPASSTQQIEEAQKHFAQGVDLYGAHDYKGALREFERAYVLAPNERLHYNLGRCFAALEDPAAALRHFVLYLRSNASIPAERRIELQTEMDRLASQVAYVAVRTNVDPSNVEVTLDKTLLGAWTTDPVIVNPGHHELSLQKPGYAPQAKEIDLAAAERSEVLFELSPKLDESVSKVNAPARPTSGKYTPRSLFAVGGAVLAGLVVLGLVVVLTRRRSAVATTSLASGVAMFMPPPPMLDVFASTDDTPISVPAKPENALSIVLDDVSAATTALGGSAGLTDIGRHKPTNQDGFLCADDDGLFIVADGIGGLAGGEIASKTAVETIRTRIHRRGDVGKLTHLPRVAGELAAAVFEANAEIRKQARANVEIADMGTTCVAARFVGGELHIAHIGDSRAYRFRDGELAQLTTDHTMEALGLVGARAQHLSRALGSEPCPQIDVLSMRPRPKDLYLLCSDGLTKMVTVADIAAVLSSGGALMQRAQALVALANEHGGKDNITVLLVELVQARG